MKWFIIGLTIGIITGYFLGVWLNYSDPSACWMPYGTLYPDPIETFPPYHPCENQYECLNY